MFFMVKFMVYFTLSFAILCIPVNGRLLFEHAYRTFAPLGRSAIEGVRKEVDLGIKKGKRLTKQLFDTAPPEFMDTVHERPAGVKLDAQSDDYTHEEERLLRNILEKDSSETK